MNIRDVAHRYRNLNTLKTPLADTALPMALENLCCEVYNPGTEGGANKTAYTIRFRTYHPDAHRMNFFGLGPQHWNTIECPPGSWVFLPHGQYKPYFIKDGRPHTVEAYQSIINVGDAMFKGEKLPSRPEAKKIRSFTV